MQVEKALSPLCNVEDLESSMLAQEQVDIPVTNYFSDNGLYAREITIPAGTLALGHAHNDEFMEVFISGTLLVPSEEGPIEISGPKVGVGKPFVRKIGLALTDVKWVTFHPVPEGCATVEKMEELIICKSKAFEQHEKEKICQLSQQLL